VLSLKSISRYDGDFEEIITDYCTIFAETYGYSFEDMIRNVFYEIYENKKDGYVLLDDNQLLGVIIFHADHDIGVIHFFHIKRTCAQYKAFKVMLETALHKIKVNVSKVVFLSEIFNFGVKQRRTMMSQFDFEEKQRDMFTLDLQSYKAMHDDPDIPLVIRPFDYENLEEIGSLAYFSFAGSMELEVFPVGFEKENFVQEMQNIFNGVYGRFLHDYSVEVYDDEKNLIGAMVAIGMGDAINLHTFFLGPKSWGKNFGYLMLVRYINLIQERAKYRKVVTFVSHENLKVKHLLTTIGFNVALKLPIYSRILK